MRFRTLLLLVPLVACGSNGAAPSATTPTMPSSVSGSTADASSASGRVLAHQNQAPISGATVSIRNGPDAGASTTTDTEGRFTLKGLHASSDLVLVYAAAPGYFDKYDNYAPLKF